MPEMIESYAIDVINALIQKTQQGDIKWDKKTTSKWCTIARGVDVILHISSSGTPERLTVGGTSVAELATGAHLIPHPLSGLLEAIGGNKKIPPITNGSDWAKALLSEGSLGALQVTPAERQVTLKGRLYINDGKSFIQDPSYTDYGDAQGIVLCGGDVFEADSELPLGHCDAPGPQGAQGVTGSSEGELEKWKSRVIRAQCCLAAAATGDPMEVIQTALAILGGAGDDLE